MGWGVSILWWVENCHFPLTKPVAVNTGLALPRSLWWNESRLPLGYSLPNRRASLHVARYWPPPAESNRLSWPGWLVIYRGGLSDRRRSPISSYVRRTVAMYAHSPNAVIVKPDRQPKYMYTLYPILPYDAVTTQQAWGMAMWQWLFVCVSDVIRCFPNCWRKPANLA